MCEYSSKAGFKCPNCGVIFETKEGLVIHLKGSLECQVAATKEIIKRTTADMGILEDIFNAKEGE